MTSERGFIGQSEERILFFLQWEVFVEFEESVSPLLRSLTMKEKKDRAIAQGRVMYASLGRQRLGLKFY